MHVRIAGKVDLQDRTGASQVRLIICRRFTHWIADAITSQLRWTAVWVALYSSKNGKTRHKHAAFSILSCAAPLETKPSGLDTATELTCLLLSSSSSYGSLDRGSGVLFDSTCTTVAENTRKIYYSKGNAIRYPSLGLPIQHSGIVMPQDRHLQELNLSLGRGCVPKGLFVVFPADALNRRYRHCFSVDNPRTTWFLHIS